MTDDPTTSTENETPPDAAEEPEGARPDSTATPTTRTRTRPRRTTRRPKAAEAAEAAEAPAATDGAEPAADVTPTEDAPAASDAAPAPTAEDSRPDEPSGTAVGESAAAADAPSEEEAPAPKRRRRASTTPRKSRAKAAVAPVEEPPVEAAAAPAEQPPVKAVAPVDDAVPAEDPVRAEAEVAPDLDVDAATAEPDVAAVVGTIEAPGSLDEPEVEVEAAAEEAPSPPARRRRRRVAATADEPAQPPAPDADAVVAEPAAADGDAADAEAAAVEPPTEAEAAAKDAAVAPTKAEDAEVEPTEAGAEEPAAEAEGAGAAVDAAVADRDDAAVGPDVVDLDVVDPEAVDADAAPAAAEGAAVDPEAETEAADTDERQDDGRPKSSRRRRRGGRGRGRRGRGEDGEAGTGADPRTDDDAAAAPVPSAVADAEAHADADRDADADAPEDGDASAPPTRLSARNRRSGGRGRTTGSGARGRARSGRVLGGVSEETRRAIAEGPPKKMLVTVGEQRTQLVVMEERNLVEHYVTRREDVSYVGNVYVGRVQNVLPGMEAAFVDIGKGRNGVLYAGEVNYDEADLEGDLPRIEQTLKPGQTVLVQVTKDPMGTKGARLTQQLSIAGRYCVLAPGDGMLGISRKLPDDERERLRKILKSIKPEQYGLIVRTAAEGATTEQLEADVARLVRIWEQVEARAADAGPLESVYEEPDLVIRVIRDVFGPEFTDLIVDDEGLAAQVRTYLGDVSPELVGKVSVQESPEPLFDGYEVTNQIRRALEKKVWLKSGGYLIVEKTEAMWVIDVNTGKFVGKSNLEETVLRNNIEAAQEIARQLRLRDMGGIIVIDFVDMLVPANRDEVLKRFKRELARDKTKSRVMEISKLGLVQMTRKNVSQGLNESFTTVCDCCEGRGAQIVPSILG